MFIIAFFGLLIISCGNSKNYNSLKFVKISNHKAKTLNAESSVRINQGKTLSGYNDYLGIQTYPVSNEDLMIIDSKTNKEDTLCDSIVMTDGSVKEVKIKKVKRKKVIYTLCCNQCTEERKLSRKDVVKIINSSGKTLFNKSKRNIDKIPKEDRSKERRKMDRVHWWIFWLMTASYPFILGLGLWLGMGPGVLLAGLVFAALITLSIIQLFVLSKKVPETNRDVRYKRRKALAIIILALVSLAISVGLLTLGMLS